MIVGTLRTLIMTILVYVRLIILLQRMADCYLIVIYFSLRINQEMPENSATSYASLHAMTVPTSKEHQHNDGTWPLNGIETTTSLDTPLGLPTLLC